MIFKHRKTTELPKGLEIIDEETRKYIDDMGKALRQTLKNIYDDLNNIIIFESWQTPSLQNSWVNFGSGFEDAQYYKDSFGIVHLKGLIKDGTTAAGTAIFTLPSGYRPAARHVFPTVIYDNTIGRIDVMSNGEVQVQHGNATWTSLSGITFRII